MKKIIYTLFTFVLLGCGYKTNLYLPQTTNTTTKSEQPESVVPVLKPAVSPYATENPEDSPQREPNGDQI